MNEQELQRLMDARSENEHLEFKEAKNRFDFEKLVGYCVALANERGGKMILGVSDKPPRKVVGTSAFDVPERTVAGIYERLHLKVAFHEIHHPDGRVLVFDVPSRPIGQPIEYDGRYYMRAGEELVGMSPDQIRKILEEGQPDWLTEPARIGCEAQDVIALLDTQSYFDLLQQPYPASREGVLDRFAKEGLILEKDGRWIINRLGAVLFAKKLEDFDLLKRKVPRVIVYDGKGKLHTRLDQLGSKGYAVGFEGLIGFINGIVPSNEIIEEALRRSVKMFPEIAIRELLANALIHQDFRETGASVMVEIFDDRIEISNPGRPFISPDRFIDEYRSRNERLADLMRRLGICEEKGSGVDKVIHSAEVFQLPAPDFRVGDHRTSAVLFAHRNFEEMDRNDRIRACYQHCCLRHVMNEKMTNQSLRERFRLSDKKTESVSRMIRDTIESGKIQLADPTATSTRYRSYIPFWA